MRVCTKEENKNSEFNDQKVIEKNVLGVGKKVFF